MTHHLRWVLCLALMVSASASAGKLNIYKNRYVEGRFIEAFVNADNSGGTIHVRPERCPGCTPQTYEFGANLRVLYGGKSHPISALAQWRRFPGEIAFVKRTGDLVKVRRTR